MNAKYLMVGDVDHTRSDTLGKVAKTLVLVLLSILYSGTNLDSDIYDNCPREGLVG